MIQLYLDTIDHRVGKYEVRIKAYDDSTARAGQWTAQQCAADAKAHVANRREIAVLGTYNSGCAQNEVPILNQDPDGPMLMVSPCNSYPGLTKPWAENEPHEYYPTGKRNYARVDATDDYEGAGAADFLHRTLHAKRVLVLHDREVYGRHLARLFVRRAAQLGLKVVADKAWSERATSYRKLFRRERSKHPDAVYLAGLYDYNGHQVVADKVSVLGNNKKVALVAPDSFRSYPDLEQSRAGRNMYFTNSGAPVQPMLAHNPVGRTLVRAFEKKYGRKPTTGYALDAVAALQVIDAAIRKSNGHRRSVTHAVFSGRGITIPATKSALGRQFTIDPHTGDTGLHTIDVYQLRRKHERFVRIIAPQP